MEITSGSDLWQEKSDRRDLQNTRWRKNSVKDESTTVFVKIYLNVENAWENLIKILTRYLSMIVKICKEDKTKSKNK